CFIGSFRTVIPPQRIVLLVLDANPLLIFFYRQRGWEYIREVLDTTLHTGQKHLLSSINLGEVYYTLRRDHRSERADETLKRIYEGPIEIAIPSLEQTLQAAIFKSKGGIS